MGRSKGRMGHWAWHVGVVRGQRKHETGVQTSCGYSTTIAHLLATVDVVAKEKVAVVVRRATVVEEPQQVIVLSVHIAFWVWDARQDR